MGQKHRPSFTPFPRTYLNRATINLRIIPLFLMCLGLGIPSLPIPAAAAKKKLVLVKNATDNYTIDVPIYFRMGKMRFHPRFRKRLKNLAAFLKKHPQIHKIQLKTYNDGLGPKRVQESLPKARARFVKKFLAQQGIKAERIEIAPTVLQKPTKKMSPKAQAKYRRIDFEVVQKREPEPKKPEPIPEPIPEPMLITEPPTPAPTPDYFSLDYLLDNPKYLAAAGSGLMFGVGVAYGGMTQSSLNQMDSHFRGSEQWQSLKSKAESRALVANIFYGIAALGAVGTGWLFYHDYVESSGSNQTEINIRATPSAGGALFNLDVKF